jgi:predicted metal-binding protein
MYNPVTVINILPSGIVLLHVQHDALSRSQRFAALQICSGCPAFLASNLEVLIKLYPGLQILVALCFLMQTPVDVFRQWAHLSKFP